MCLTAAFACLSFPTLADDPKPNASVKNKNIEAGVFLRSMRVDGKSGVGVKFLDADVHVELAIIAV